MTAKIPRPQKQKLKMNLTFDIVGEPTKAAAKWQQLFYGHWPAYKFWLTSNGFNHTLSLKKRQNALKKHMPEMWDTYKHLCSLIDTDDNDLAAQFLTGWCPPAYISGCAQAVINTDEIQLVRNYDYSPLLLEGTLLLSKWNENQIIGTSDCLIGIVDGMNDAGLCVSLTFGGRREVGVGFGIPFILRYVLEFCTTTKEAVKVLKRVPSHMSYNVTVVDKTGATKTVMLAPDKAPVVTNDAYATNHQGTIDWPENAQFNQTIKRSNFLKNFLKTENVSASELAKAFLYPPLYNTTFKEGFGTLYTAVYQPENLVVKLLWPEAMIERSFDYFPDEQIYIEYNQPGLAIIEPIPALYGELPVSTYNWQDAVVDSLVNVMAGRKGKAKKDELRNKLMPDGHIAWEVVEDYWNEPSA